LDLLEALISGLRAVLQKAIDENCDGVVENFTSQDLEVSGNGKDIIHINAMSNEA